MSAATATSYTGGACATGRIKALAGTNATLVRNSAGNLYGIFVAGSAASAATVYLKFYDKAAAPTVGTDTPKFTLPIISTTTLPGWVEFEVDTGISFTNGIAYAITGGVADSDTTAVAADACHGAFFYK